MSLRFSRCAVTRGMGKHSTGKRKMQDEKLVRQLARIAGALEVGRPCRFGLEKNKIFCLHLVGRCGIMCRVVGEKVLIDHEKQ